ncbi:gag-pol polyprotein [Lasius niger]|uniref:Gag-pol polyprotein n=1 Tax=Lasius niger TaxID=67767 RepID=A0A0J7MTZ2_LASNI|nr:gag-pol polyprotein [Lasius niger]
MQGIGMATPKQHREDNKNKRKKRTPPSRDTKVNRKRKESGDSSHAQSTKGKGADPEWQEVRNRKSHKQQSMPMLPNALDIQPKEQMSYAEILSRTKKDSSLEEIGKSVNEIRRTAAGDFTLILDKVNPEKTAQFCTTIKGVLRQDVAVKSRVQETNIEIKDLDKETTKEEVCKALIELIGVDGWITLESIRSIRKAYGDTQTAVVRLAAETAKKVVDAGKIRIGWVICHVREQIQPIKCHKCWQYGHMLRNCKSEIDRTRNCVKCGATGHKINKCKREAHCVLCEKKGSKACGHIAGSGRCPVYTLALQALIQK